VKVSENFSGSHRDHLLGSAETSPRPLCKIEATNLHLGEMATQVVSGAIAAELLGQAEWPMSSKTVVPANMVIDPLPPEGLSSIQGKTFGGSCTTIDY
jgi:hypothetical protein